ncbi:NADH-quinone oxidoreductase subunit NuoN [Arcanobacterium wilhelmae]|nr:NADH-quinone oxidoreductase subunit NuoN [Arcanobacterium wilhelmae]WFN91161.1 NADH-quinone oxidoreductase subunit NuoN [Arcanobacterium wilhelmae]
MTPLLIVLGAAVLSTLVEAFWPREYRRPVQLTIAILAIAGGLLASAWRWTEFIAGGRKISPYSVLTPGNGTPTLSEQATQIPSTGIGLVEDGISIISFVVLLVVALIAFLVIADRTHVGDGSFVASAATRPGSAEERESTSAGRMQTEIFPLALFAMGGMMAFTAAFDLLTLFIALELLSLPLYVLSASARRRRLLSQEAAMKYFLLGAFSSAVFLMGAAFIYGGTGRVSFFEVASVAGGGPNPALLGSTSFTVIGVVMVILGLLFKVGAAPFHQWVPDVYQGAPTPITAFMAAGTKAAAFAALIRVMMFISAPAQKALTPFLWIVIIATILVGTVMGLVQKDIKRLLAYSSIAHAGFILIAVLGIAALPTVAADLSNFRPTATAVAAIFYYLLTYGFATIGAFGVITLVRGKDSAGNIVGEATDLDSWRGLGKRSPFLAASMLVFLLSFAGIPFTGGFIGKFEAFRAGINAGGTVLVVIAVLASAATAFFYFRLVALMFFEESESDSTVVVKSEGMSMVAIVVALVATIALGILPAPFLDFMQGSFIL